MNPITLLGYEPGAIQEVLGNPGYRDTGRFQRTIAQTHGLDRAADVPERAFQLVDELAVVAWEKPLDTDAHSPTETPADLAAGKQR